MSVYFFVKIEDYGIYELATKQGVRFHVKKILYAVNKYQNTLWDSMAMGYPIARVCGFDCRGL